MISRFNWKTLSAMLCMISFFSATAAHAGLQSEMRRLCRSVEAEGSSRVYYSNGNLFAEASGEWFYPNGNLMTRKAGMIGATWYYSNGNLLTQNAGEPGAHFFRENGSLLFVTPASAPVGTLAFPCDFLE